MLAAMTAPLENFHPALQAWFSQRFAAPTAVQQQAWPRIAAGEHVLATAPTGSGKTLTAFLWALHQFATGAWRPGQTRVLYVSPLKALNNDIQRNLLTPLQELREGHRFPRLRVLTRSGDTPQGERQRMLRRPPDILITTPESLMLLLTRVRGRQALAGLKTVILDEIHALVDNRRGAQLMVSVERLARLAGEFQRIALSATVHPLQAVASYIGGYGGARAGGGAAGPRPVAIVAGGQSTPAADGDAAQQDKKIALQVCCPEEALAAPADGRSLWDALSPHFRTRIQGNRATLFFTNSRALAEKITAKINANQPSPLAYAHHGSLARDIRTEVERRLKAGELRAIVATSSLEMGIDIGHLDEVVLVQSPPSIAATLQRVGRAGHGVGEVSRGVLHPTHSQDLLQAAALAEAVAMRDLEPLTPLENPLDILCQTIISLCADETWPVDDIFALLRASAPYRKLPREQFDLVLELLAGRYAGARVRELEPRIAYDRINRTARARRSALLALYNAGGAIVDRGYYQLRYEDTGAVIGELDEEFVWEAATGQTFTLGTQNWQIRRITHNDVIVRPAKPGNSAPPFWRNEAQNRSFHFSQRIQRFLETAEGELASGAGDILAATLTQRHGFDPSAAAALTDYLGRQRRHTDAALPHRRHLLFEQVQSGPDGYLGPDAPKHMVIHSFWGGRLNRPWALALEAAWRQAHDSVPEIHADDDAIIIRYKHRLPPEEVLSLVTPENLDSLLRESLERSGFFGARFRECAGRALLLAKRRFNHRLPLWMSRLQAKKLMTATKKYADFPVLLETWRTCLVDEFDLPALRGQLAAVADGAIGWSCTATSAPSPFARNLSFDHISRYMYADDAPERDSPSSLHDDLIRQAVRDEDLRPRLQPEVIAAFEAKRQRRTEGYAPQHPDDWLEWAKERVLTPAQEWPPDIEHERLVRFFTAEAGFAAPPNAASPMKPHSDPHRSHKNAEQQGGTATDGGLGDGAQAGGYAAAREGSARAWVAHLELAHCLVDTGLCAALIGPKDFPVVADARSLADLLSEILSFYGPRTLAQIEALLPPLKPAAAGADLHEVAQSLVASGAWVDTVLVIGSDVPHFCDADNLDALLRLQRARGRPEVLAKPVQQLPGFLAAWQGFGQPWSDAAALAALERLSGYAAPGDSWLHDLLGARFAGFSTQQLDDLASREQIVWLGAGPGRIILCQGEDAPLHTGEAALATCGELAHLFQDQQARYGFHQLSDRAGTPAAAFNERWWRAVWSGALVTDSLAPLRLGASRNYQLAPASASARRRARAAAQGWPGNWRLNQPAPPPSDAVERLEAAKELLRTLLDRYGWLCREIVNREAARPEARWSALFRALRIMELAGEVTAGYFFTGLSGPQFITAGALHLFRRQQAPVCLWMSALDPASPCGLSLDWPELPARRPGNYLSFLDGALALVVRNNGQRLHFLVAPDHGQMDSITAPVQHLAKVRRRLRLETVNGAPARRSPYLEALDRTLARSSDHRHVFYEQR